MNNESKCNHQCSGNCRRVGCNCACGEFHTPAPEDWETRLTQIMPMGYAALRDFILSEKAAARREGAGDVKRTLDRIEDEVRKLKRASDSSTYLYGQGESHAYEEVLKLLNAARSEGVNG